MQRKWWIDRNGKDFLCTKGSKESPDDLHLGCAEDLWDCTTWDAMCKGMVRVVRYDGDMFYEHSIPMNRKQLSTLGDLAIEENCTLTRT